MGHKVHEECSGFEVLAAPETFAKVTFFLKEKGTALQEKEVI